jgi:hypothetical protein
LFAFRLDGQPLLGDAYFQVLTSLVYRHALTFHFGLERPSKKGQALGKLTTTDCTKWKMLDTLIVGTQSSATLPQTFQ